jgi:hypothetical protein
VGGLLGGFCSEYLKTRAAHLATKADFDSLKAQLEINTILVEQIKVDVATKDWLTRESINLRREKLELVVSFAYDSNAFLSHLWIKISDNDFSQDHAPYTRMGTIGTLYLRSLDVSISKFVDLCAKTQDWMYARYLEVPDDPIARRKMIDGHGTEVDKQFDELRNSRRQLENAARNLLEEWIPDLEA